jgi:hypothetical protein
LPLEQVSIRHPPAAANKQEFVVLCLGSKIGSRFGPIWPADQGSGWSVRVAQPHALERKQGRTFPTLAELGAALQKLAGDGTHTSVLQNASECRITAHKVIACSATRPSPAVKRGDLTGDGLSATTTCLTLPLLPLVVPEQPDKITEEQQCRDLA